MSRFQWSSMQRMVAFVRDMTSQISHQARVNRFSAPFPAEGYDG